MIFVTVKNLANRRGIHSVLVLVCSDPNYSPMTINYSIIGSGIVTHRVWPTMLSKTHVHHTSHVNDIVIRFCSYYCLPRTRVRFIRELHVGLYALIVAVINGQW